MRLRARVDKNQKEIVECFREKGATVFPTHQLGKGFPDLVVGYAGRNLLVEVKSEKGALTEDERLFHSVWRGEVRTVRTKEDVRTVLENMA
jgi:Holliday junction resolvase